MNKLLALHFIHIIDVQILLWGRGNDSYKNTQNTEMFKTVQFFSECCRISKTLKL